MTDKLISTELRIAELVHGAMVHAVRQFPGNPIPWMNGNSHAEDYARGVADEIIAATLLGDMVEALKEAKARLHGAASEIERLRHLAKQDGRPTKGISAAIEQIDVALSNVLSTAEEVSNEQE